MVIPLLFSLLLLLSFTDTTNGEEEEYLKLRLLHKNPFSTPSQTLASDSHRLSILFSSLQSHKKALKSPLISGASTGSGQYFVDFRVGTPPQKLLLVADTGSDLVWVKSSACRNCSNHSPGSSYFPRHSSTFAPFHCYDRHCRLVPRPPQKQHCNLTRVHSSCRYEYEYADGSKTSGFFSKESITLNTSSGRETKVRNLAFGCGFSVSGSSVSGASFNGANGVMGLGQGPISFSSQVGKQFGSNKFSYCLMDYTISPPPTSYLMIGKAPNKPKLSFTPLQSNPLSPTFYYIGIQSVYVDAIKLPIKPSVFAFDGEGNGGTVIDSGTTLSFLVEPAYKQIVKAFKKKVKKLKKLKIINDPALSFDLCFNVSGVDVTNLRLPKLSFRFVGDKKSIFFSPPTENYFIDAIEDVKCLALQPVITVSGFSVIGNLMQQGYLFEFDRDQSRLGFSRQGCALP